MTTAACRPNAIRRDREFDRDRRVCWRVPLVALITLGLAIASATATTPPSTPPIQQSTCTDLLNERARLFETDHFGICYDTSFEALRPLIGRLEGTYDAALRYCRANDLTGEAPAGRLPVVLFERYEDFTGFLSGIGMNSASIAGIYDHATNIAAFVNVANSPNLQRITGEIQRVQSQLQQMEAPGGANRNRQTQRKSLQNRLQTLHIVQDDLVRKFNRFVVQHEAVHQLFFNIGLHTRGADNPSWVTEGLACQFEVPQLRRGKVLTGINHIRLADFRDALGVSPSSKQAGPDAVRRAVGKGDFLPFRILISNGAALSQGDDNPAYRYAQAWALVYYLNRVHNPEWADYLRRLSTRPPGQRIESDQELDAFEEAFGRPDATFDHTVIDYILDLRFDPRAAGR